MLTLPKVFSIFSNIDLTSLSDPTSPKTEMDCPPLSIISFSTDLASDSFVLAFTATAAPREANRRAVALPIFRPEPVTKATFPFKD